MKWFVIIALAFLLATETSAGTFRDDFEDGNLSGWELKQSRKAVVEFQVENGEASIQTNSPPRLNGVRQDCRGTMIIGSNDWRNYTLELRVKIVERDYETGGKAIIGIRTEELPIRNIDEPLLIVSPIGVPPGVYMEIIPGGMHGYIRVHKIIKIDPPIVLKMINLNGKMAPLKQTHRWEKVLTTAKTIAFDTWYPVKMVAKDERFKLYFNDEIITRFDDANIMSGKVRLTAIGAHVHFDDVVITGKNIADIGPSGMSVSAKGKLTTTWGSIKRYSY